MKLHKNRKREKNIQRFLSVALALCIVISNSAAHVAASEADTAAEVHQHTDSCYVNRPVDENGEHGDECLQNRLICGRDGEEVHVHDDSCREAVSMSGRGAEEHNESCYKRILICEENTEHDRTVLQAKANPEMSRTEERNNEEAPTETAAAGTIDAGEVPESAESSEAAESSDSLESSDSSEPLESAEPSDPLEATESSEAADPSEPSGSENPVPEDAEDENGRILICEAGEEGHIHTDDCYRSMSCGMTAHMHGEDCRDEEGNLICEKEVHEHKAICFLSREEIEKIERVNQLISAIPAYEEIAEKLENREETDSEAFEDWFRQLAEQTGEAEEAYNSLEKELYRYVTDADKLLKIAEEIRKTKDFEETEAYEEEYRDDKVVVRVKAEPGVIPKEAVLSVKQVVPQDVEKIRRDAGTDEAAVTEAKELNAKYEDVQKNLEASVAEDETKEIAGFLAYDISFLVTDENGGTKEIEPEGNVSVTMEFAEAYLPEEIADSEEIRIDSVDVVHMKEVEDEETGETALMAQVLEDAELSTTENAELEKAEFVVDSFSIFTISWTTKDGKATLSLDIVCVEENGNRMEGWESKATEIKITQEESELHNRGRVFLPALAPYFQGYVLDRIVLGKSGKQGEQSNIQIEEIRYLDNGQGSTVLQRQTGKWINGEWNGTGSYKIWDSEVKEVYFVYKPLVTPNISEESTAKEKVPEHRKYIRYNGGNDYTLTLDVKGEQEPQNVDVLLIVDNSGSMRNLKDGSTGKLLPDEKQRFSIVNSALEVLDQSLQEIAAQNDKLKINVGIVLFGGDAGGSIGDWYYVKSDNTPDAKVAQEWTEISETKGFGWRIEKDKIDGNTNWQAGIRTGEEMLEQCPASDRKYVVFLTDGDPTIRYAATSNTISVGTGTATRPEAGKYGDPYNNNYDAALNEWMMSPALQSAVKTFVIAVADKEAAASAPILEICNNFARNIEAEIYSGQDSADLQEMFRKIVADIKYSSFKEVVITDTLSDYVEFAEEEPTFTATYTKADSAEVFPLDESQYGITCTKKGEKTETEEGEIEATANTIKFSVLNGAELEDGVTYSISFRVKPTEKAVREYIASGYPHVGEEDTDAPGNTTSSGKPGFYSNSDDRAKVNYIYNENKPKDAEYAHPVVQVDKPGEDEPGITKTMGKAEENNRYPITIQIKCGKITGNILTGSAGEGWKVFDSMAPYTNFLSFRGAEINGHQLVLSEDGCLLTTTLKDGSKFTAASFSEGTIIWNLNPELAEVVLDEDGNGYCSYTLTYYVNFSDSGRTEVRNTNAATYIMMPDGDSTDYLYPEKMPFFVNVTGQKKSTFNAGDSMQGAEFNVYRDKEKTMLIAQNVVSDGNGHFAFQLGQSDLCGENPESGQMTVYLEEVKAPQGYEKDSALHPITISISNVEYKPAETKEKAQPGIWGTAAAEVWGTVISGTVGVEHKAHDEVSPDFLNVVSDSGQLALEYYNTKQWRIAKVSASNHELFLAGAEFTLYEATDAEKETTKPLYTGTSDAEGYVRRWNPVAGGTGAIPSHLLPAGTYELRETKAPSGYALSDEAWIIVISKEGKVDISVKSDKTSVPCSDGNFYFENAILYSLPSAGGIGIYWYTIGGTLLLMAGVLILYKRKYVGRCREGNG